MTPLPSRLNCRGGGILCVMTPLPSRLNCLAAIAAELVCEGKSRAEVELTLQFLALMTATVRSYLYA